MQQQLDISLITSTERGFRIQHAAKKILIPAFNEFFQGLTRWQGSRADRNGQIYRHATDLARLIDSTQQRPV
ncbi:MAG: hypothetical protein AAF433_02310 [Bacteroidota bacterium]